MGLILKAVPPTDYRAFHALQNDPLVSRMSGTIPYPIDMAFVTKRMKVRAENERTVGTLIERGVYADGVLVGGGTLFTTASGGWEIGYFIGEPFRGKGYATATATALVKLLRQRGHFGPVHADHAKDNGASGRVLEKIGFIRTGEAVAKSAGRDAPSANWCLTLPAEENTLPLTLKPLAEADFGALYEVQNDDEAAWVAGGGSHGDRDAFTLRMANIVKGDQMQCALAVMWLGGTIAGYLGHFIRDGKDREVSLWLDRAVWGKGLATRAMHMFLGGLPDQIKAEPIFARVVDGNDASARVMEKNGFFTVGRETYYSDIRRCEVEETLFKR